MVLIIAGASLPACTQVTVTEMGASFQQLLDGEAASTLPSMAANMVAEDMGQLDLSIMQVRAWAR